MEISLQVDNLYLDIIKARVKTKIECSLLILSEKNFYKTLIN